MSQRPEDRRQPEWTAELRARVVELVPETVDEDRVYEWLGVVQVSTGQTLALFDAPAEIRTAINTEWIFELLAILPSVMRVEEPRCEVGSWVNQMANPAVVEEPAKGWRRFFGRRFAYLVIQAANPIQNPYCYGRVVRIERPDQFLLDVGCGTLHVYHGGLKPVEVRPDWFVRISDFRLDVLGHRPADTPRPSGALGEEPR